MQGLAPTQEQTSDTGSETSITSGEQLEYEVNELMDEIFGNDEIDVHSDRRQFLIAGARIVLGKHMRAKETTANAGKETAK